MRLLDRRVCDNDGDNDFDRDGVSDGVSNDDGTN